MYKDKTMFEFRMNDSFNPLTVNEKNAVVEFLYKHLDEFGDSREDITRAIEYALKETASHGGFVLTLRDGYKIGGALVMNKTGMQGYIPENILVYAAIHKEHRDKGLGQRLIEKAIELSHGDIALHVAPQNPAKSLYEKIGFTNKYLEMRYKK